MAISCLPEVTWPDLCAAPVSWVPERVPRGFRSGEPSGAAQLFRRCEPHILLSGGLSLGLLGGVGAGCEDLGLDAFVTLETSFRRACGPVAFGVHALLLAPPASKQAKVRTKTLQAEFPRDSRLSGPGRCPLLLARRAGELQIRPGPDPLGGFQAYRSWPGRALAAGASLLRDVGCGPRERRPL